MWYFGCATAHPKYHISPSTPAKSREPIFYFNGDVETVMKKLVLLASLLVLTSLLLAGCEPRPTGTQVEVTPTAPVVAAVSASPTVQPTSTPLPGKVILYAPAGVNSQSVQDRLAGLSGSSGMALEVHSELVKEQLGEEVRVVVLLAVPGNLQELLSAAPQAQFLAISSGDLPGAANLTVLRRRLENQAFLAGFITVLLSPDYRAAGLLPSDGPLGETLTNAFVNGGKYYCGVCASGWPYNVYYPQAAVLPAASDGASWQATLTPLFDTQMADVLYLAPEAARPEVIAYLQGKTQFDRTVLLVGEQLPAEELRSQWAAAVGFDVPAALEEVWPDVSTGTARGVFEVPLRVEDVNDDLLGPGRMRLVDELLEELQAGSIYPFTLPLE